MKKRILSVVLALCMVFSMIPIYVSADDVDTSEIVKAEWEYEMYGDGVALTAYNGTASDVYVPSTIHIGETEYAVLKLADSIFENNDSLNSVTLGAGILEIGNRAFYDCDNMVCILLAYETATIGDEAFYSCDAFNSIILYDTVTTIGADAFAKCPKLVIWCNEGTVGYAYALENNIPYEILNPDAEPEVFSQGGITYYALNGEANAVGYDSAVADVVIPAEVDGYPVTSVKDIFNNSTTLKSIEINALITEINSNKFSGCSNLVSVKLPNSIKAIGASAFKGCGSLKNIVLPSGITSIGGEAFYGCNALTEITIPNGVKVIPESCFNDCRNLVTVNLPEGLTSIYERAFWFCRNLKNIEIPSTVRTIDDCAFYDCSSITDITIPDGITVLGFSSFEGCSSLKNVVIPNSVTKLEGDNFRGCSSLETVTLPGNMGTWRLEFSGCSSLKTVIISEGSTSVKYYNGFGDSITEVILPSTLKEIQSNAFSSCTNLTNIVIPEGVQTIGAGAFSGCSKMKNVVIPKSVTNISADSFHGATIWLVYENSYTHTFAENNNLMYFVISGSEMPQEFVQGGITYYIVNGEANAVGYDSAVADVVIPAEVDGYPVTSVKDIFNNSTTLKSVEINALITEINSNKFSGCSNLVSVKLPNSIKAIGASAFKSCTKLNNIVLPSGITSIGEEAFCGCIALTEIAISNGVKTIPESCFYNCHKLVTVDLPEGLTSINRDAFRHCESLKNIEIPSTVRTIDDNAFESCSSLTEITIPDGITTLGSFSFAFCSSLKSIAIPNSVTSLEGGCFMRCTFLGTVTLPGNMNTWCDEFRECPMLKTVIISEGSTSVKDYGFEESVTEVILPSTLKEIQSNAFSSCTNLTNIVIPEGVQTIGAGAFSGCSKMKNVVIPKSVTNISADSFHSATIWLVYENSYTHTFAENNNLMYFVISGSEMPQEYVQGGITYYIVNGEANAVGYDSAVADVVIPAEVDGYPVTSVKDIFNNSTTLKSIEINALITEINSNKFSGCSNLVSVKLPNSIKAIGASAFKSCTNLNNIVLPSGITSIGAEAFYGCNALTEITIPNGVKVIPESCFNDCRNLVTVNLPEGLTSIYKRAFWFCRNLKNIEIPSTVRTIDEDAFYDCSSITDITIPDGITVLGFSSFEGCSSLKNVVIPNSVTKLEGDNFRDCTSLETVTLPGNMDTWRLEFFGCSSLKTVIISEGSTSVKDYGFEESVTEIILPSTLKEIQSNAFSSCTNLTNIVIPEGVQTIGAGAFSGCLKMKNVVIPKSVTNIRADSFHSATIWLVYENSYAHTFAENNDLLYFVMRKTENPEINYGARISGTVTYTDGSIASDVAVEIIYDDGVCKETVKTDLNGAYEFTYAEVGRYTIRVVDSNNNTASSAVSVKRMNVFDVFVAGDTDLTLKRGYTVSGTVNEANANVTITDKDGNVIDSVISDRNGYFLISNIPNGEYILKAETENGSVTTEITVFNAEIGGLELIIVTETASLWGYVEIEDRSENHHRRSWVQITVYNQDGIAVDQCKTDKDGKYNFKNLPLGEYVIVAETSEMRPDKEHGYDRNYNLTGYAYINITEAREYKVETIVLYEESESKADIIGKVTAKGSPQISIVTLTNVFGDEIDSVTTGKNGKFVFKNVSDGMYFIWAVTENDGSGFAVVVVRKGKIYGDTKIKVEKNSSIKEHEDNFKSEFDNICDKESAILHKERIAQEKRYFDGLSQKEKKQLSKYYIDKINELSQWIAACEYNTIGDVTVEGGLVVSGNEIENEEQIAFTINVTKTNAPSVSTDGVKNKEDFNNHSIKDKAGKKEIKQYYEITMTKTTADGDKAITSVYKDTDSNSKFRITLTIPEEYRGYKNYSFVHEHHGEVITLCDLDNDPNTVTFEVDKFSTFVLTATNEEQGEDVLSGDLDLDGKTSATDLSMLKKVLLGTDNGKSPILNDVNDDNKTDICDLVRLKKGLSGT